MAVNLECYAPAALYLKQVSTVAYKCMGEKQNPEFRKRLILLDLLVRTHGLLDCIHLPGFQKTRNHHVSETGSVSVLRCRNGRRHLLSWIP
jgi:hypothetical protein